MMGLARLMELFDAIDEDVIDCWNRRCTINNGYCEKLTQEKALAIHQNLGRISPSERFKGYDWFERAKSVPGETQSALLSMGLRETQSADIFITQKWLQNRIWVLCSTHGLLRPISDRHELSFNYAISIAKETLAICQSLRLSSMEAHGIGLVSWFHLPIGFFLFLTHCIRPRSCMTLPQAPSMFLPIFPRHLEVITL